MINIWIIAAGAAVAAAAYVARRGRRRSAEATPGASLEPVSTEWLSHARGRGDDNW